MKAALVLCALLGGAPLQCSGEPDPYRGYDRPEESLYALAGRFKADGDTEAWEKTLHYIIERYPNSRFSARAKDDLARTDPK